MTLGPWSLVPGARSSVLVPFVPGPWSLVPGPLFSVLGPVSLVPKTKNRIGHGAPI